jgi:hypothetical protein
MSLDFQHWNTNGKIVSIPTATPTALELAIKQAAVKFEGPENCSALGGNAGERCMWSVQQVLMNGGAGQLGNGSYNIDSAIQSALNANPPQVTIEPPSCVAQPGDLVDWWGGGGSTTWSSCEANAGCSEHVGICLNVGCTSAIANSTQNSSGNTCSFTDNGSAANPQGQGSAFTNSQIIHVNY